MQTVITEIHQDNEILRNEFHKFISKIFPSISFVEWRAKGFWTENYLPFSILESGKIISNISAAFMNILINGKKRKAIQLGAIGTLPEYREQGLARKLMNHILEKYEDKVDFFFLFGNDSVQDFYPKFGFRKVIQSIFIAETKIPNPAFSTQKLDLKNKADFLLLQNLLIRRKPLTKILGAENHGFITMWHVLNLYRNDLYYLEAENALVIKQEKSDVLHVLDVIFKHPFDFHAKKIIESDSIKKIRYYFPPDQLKYDYDKILPDDSGLFVRGEFDPGNEPFRLPETAVT